MFGREQAGPTPSGIDVQPQAFTVSDGGQGVDVVVCTTNGGGSRRHDTQGTHAFLPGEGDFLLQSIGPHTTVLIALDLDDVLMTNADDIGRHEHGVVGLCGNENHGRPPVKSTLCGTRQQVLPGAQHAEHVAV